MDYIRYLIVFIIFVTGCQQMEYQQSEILMDTVVTIKVTSKDQKIAHDAMKEAFEEMRRVEKKFTIHNKSPLSKLNKKGSLVTEDEEMKRLVRKGIYYSQITNNSFDITVQPVLDLYKKSFEVNGRPPSEEEIEQAVSKTGYSKVTVNETGIFLNDTKITLGGIAKGFAIDQGIETLQMENISAAFINAGGDIFGYGRKSSGELWKTALLNPDNKKEFIESFTIDDEGIATSGNYERYFDESREYHHIIDPATGKSANKCISVTVLASSATQADALSTALFVMGEDGVELVKKLGVEAVFVFSNRSIKLVDGKS